ncbi:uncharacterized protein BXZ73DRAFT_97901 [Epithele typhae]|uniref:uncharacterized protein n=1 Tax=Epithele typhae TaxID=378194 RepID=UPI0020075D06|nr:uncharacterized protein BXZ73DRAFT_97901 [Epithele typhae]KAH9942491.1 hypothetical protein BXZ73DRAFT_97901 [Epithele typhae]
MSNPPIPADAPFDQPSADIVLRSADHVDFRAHRVILAQASPFFADMFSLPQTSPPDASALPVVDMSEDSKTLRRLLLLCYPVDKQELDSVADIAPVLAAARKFDMEWPIRLLARDLDASLSRSPLHAWACACRSGLEDVARRAAEEIKRRVSSKAAETEDPDPDSCIALLPTLRAALEEEGLTDVLQGVSGGAYFRLREYVREASPLFSIGPGSISAVADEPPPERIRPGFLPPYPPPDATILCSDGVLVEAHEVIIALRLPGISIATPGQGTYTLDAPSTALVDILTLCYRGKSNAPAHGTDIDGLACVLAVCEKSPMDAQMFNAPRKLWDKCVQTDPFRAYLAAAKRGLGEEDVRVAARKTLAITLLGLYTEQLEDAEAMVYERLLKYHHDASIAVVGVLAQEGDNWSHKLLGRFRIHDNFPETALPMTPARLIKDATRKLSVGRYAPASSLEVMGIGVSTPIEAALQEWRSSCPSETPKKYSNMIRDVLWDMDSTLRRGIRGVLDVARLALQT